MGKEATSQVSAQAIKRTLNNLWEEQRLTKELLTNIQDQLKRDAKILPEVLDKLGEKFIVLSDTVGNIEPVSVDGLLEELKAIKDLTEAVAAKEMPEMPDPVAFPEIQKVAGKVEVKDLAKVADKIAEKLAPMLDKDGTVKVSNLPEKQEIFGKTLTKIDGNSADNPLAVRLSDGEKFVDLESLFKVTVNSNGGGGATITGAAEATQTNYNVIKTEATGYKYIALAPPGTSPGQPLWQCLRVDKTTTGNTIIEWADGNDNFDNTPGVDGANLASLSYS